MFKRREKPPQAQDSFGPRTAGGFGLERASVIAAILAFLLIGGEVFVAQYLQANHTALSFFTIFDPALTCLTALLALAGLIVGVLAVLRRERKRLLAILGLAFNGLFLLLVLVLYAINVSGWMRGGG